MVWAFVKARQIENLHNEFLRYITNSNKSTPVYMLHAELGRRPIDVTIKTRLIGFWMNIINGKESKVSKLLYDILFHQYRSGEYQHKWIHSIKEELISIGRFDLFNTRITENPISVTLVDLHISSKVNKKKYYLYKQSIKLENYMVKLNKKQYSALLKYKLSNHRLPFEKGRWENTPLDERKCYLCTKPGIGDEFHYLFICYYVQAERKQFLIIFLQKTESN